MISFTKAPLVAQGDRITAAEHVKQRLAFNDRMRSGIGDPTYRIHYMFLNLFRQIRNPSGFVFPAQAEFQQFYEHLDRAHTDAKWPDAGPGDPEGINLANPAGAFVFGNPDVDTESDRLNVMPLSTTPAPTPDEAWEFGRQQRGAYDPITGALGSPSFTAAQSYYRIVQPYYSPMGKAYGGFMPVPQVVGDCGDATMDVAATPKFQIIFTPLKEGLPVKYYIGFCPTGDSGAPAGTGPLITFIARAPFAYFIFLAAGGVERLGRKDYIEGPYSGGAALQHTDPENLTRMLNRFIADWRGSTNQRKADDYQIEDIAFSFQEFFTSQYLLSPNRGAAVGDQIEALYPFAAFQSPSGFVPHGTLSGQHPYADGFVLGGVRVKATDLGAPATVDVLSGDSVIASLTVNPDENGAGTAIKFFSDGPRPNPLRFRLASDAQFRRATGVIECEATEQFAYKPEIHDAYLVLRLATSRGLDDEFDLRGPDYSLSRVVFDSYLKNGCAVSQAGVSGISATSAPINVNSWFDAARRLARDNTRIIPRDQFIGYEVTDGKSILYFKRYALADADNRADSFDSIAGAIDPIASGAIREGYTYIVRGASILYDGRDYHDGQTFVGVSGGAGFEPEEAASIFEKTAVRALAPPTGYSNEWLMFPQFFVYAPEDDETNPFKPSDYADYFALNERCHFYSPWISAHDDLVSFFDYGDPLSLQPESPTGWRYVKGTNPMTEFTDDARLNFYRSCRIYEPDAEIESAVEQIEEGVAVVKVTFKTRLHNCPEAFGSIPRDVAGWDVTALRDEPYRSIENGLREYLVLQSLTTNATKKPGDTAAQSAFFETYDGVFGAVFPRFFFTRLIPLPAEESPPNATVETNFDSPIIYDEHFQMEAYLRAMCEGYIDEATSLTYACASGVSDFFDYTFENLLFDSSGGRLRWLSFLPLKVRPDGPQGFHALPNTVIYADAFNALSNAVNKLDKVRVMLPVKLRCRVSSFNGSRSSSPNIWDESGCSLGFVRAIGNESPGAAENLLGIGDWDDCTAIGASSGAAYLDACDGGQFVFGWSVNKAEFKFELVAPIALEALPEDLRDMVNSNQTGFIGVKLVQSSRPRSIEVATSGEAQGCCFGFEEPCPGFFFSTPLAHGWRFESDETNITTCELFRAGVVDPGSPPAGDFYIGRSAGGAFCVNQSTRSIGITPIADSPNFFIVVPLIE